MKCLRLDEAAICLDCELIYCQTAEHCPACGSSQNFGLYKWLQTTKELPKDQRGYGDE